MSYGFTIRIPVSTIGCCGDRAVARYRGSDDFRDWRDDWEWQWGVPTTWGGEPFGTPVLWRSYRSSVNALRTQINAPPEPAHVVLPPWLYATIRGDR